MTCTADHALTRVFLATAHRDHNPTNNRSRNLAALCQRCHILPPSGVALTIIRELGRPKEDDWKPISSPPSIDMDVVLRLEGGDEIEARWEAEDHPSGEFDGHTDLTAPVGRWVSPDGNLVPISAVEWKQRISNRTNRFGDRSDPPR